MLTALNILFIGLGITAYVAAHAYVVFVLKAPAARRVYESTHRRGQA